ncbi:uncharacterized protein LOC136075966 [Hydra vulgaris]|uniref:Uncharacterized protein LOC136075966 n=1 Tax=Hydra vulgaris TaxID=6087 RepID=A0ABM4B9E5_HYDVU
MIFPTKIFLKNYSQISLSSLDSTNRVLPDIADKQIDPLVDIIITPASVSKLHYCLDSSTACGLDSAPFIVLQKCSSELSLILSKLFNNSLSESCFPSCWKAASVIPIIKNSGEQSELSNYRPISLLTNARFYRALDWCGEVKAIALDISEAFDKIWHVGLLHKLSSYSVTS